MSQQEPESQSTPPRGMDPVSIASAVNGAYKPPKPLPREPLPSTAHDEWTGQAIGRLWKEFGKLHKAVWLAVAVPVVIEFARRVWP